MFTNQWKSGLFLLAARFFLIVRTNGDLQVSDNKHGNKIILNLTIRHLAVSL